MLLARQLRQVKAVHMQVAGAILFKGAGLSSILLAFEVEAVTAMAHQQSVQTGAAHGGQHGLGRFEQVVQGEVASLPHQEHPLGFLVRERIVNGVRAARAILRTGMVLPMVDGAQRDL